MCPGQAKVPKVDMRSLVWLIDQPFHSLPFLYVLAPIPIESCYVLPVSVGIDGSPNII